MTEMNLIKLFNKDGTDAYRHHFNEIASIACYKLSFEAQTRAIRFPRLWASLHARPKKIPKNQTANTAAASYAAYGTKVPQENRAQAALLNPEKARPASTAVLT